MNADRLAYLVTRCLTVEGEVASVSRAHTVDNDRIALSVVDTDGDRWRTMLSDWLAEVIRTLRGTAARLSRPPVLDVRYRRSAEGEVDLEARLSDVDDLDTDAAVDRVITMIESVHDAEEGRRGG